MIEVGSFCITADEDKRLRALSVESGQFDRVVDSARVFLDVGDIPESGARVVIQVELFYFRRGAHEGYRVEGTIIDGGIKWTCWPWRLRYVGNGDWFEKEVKRVLGEVLVG